VLIANPPVGIPRARFTLDQLLRQVAVKSLVTQSFQPGVASAPQSLDNGNTSASQLFLGNTALKSFTEPSYLKGVAI
jgi:hypothetical protein